MTIRIIVTVCAIFSLPVHLPTTWACECDDPTQRDAFRRARAVFVGTITAITPNPDHTGETRIYPAKVSFSVEKRWKGPLAGAIVVYPDQGFLSCWNRKFNVGDRYLVYAFERKLLVTTNCGRTMPPGRSAADLKNLNSFWWRLDARVFPR
jgi:hypothetical protein